MYVCLRTNRFKSELLDKIISSLYTSLATIFNTENTISNQMPGFSNRMKVVETSPENLSDGLWLKYENFLQLTTANN